MRTIKFRAWAERYKKMYQWEELLTYGANDIFDTDTNAEWGGTQMQYIGLTDNSNKEIYEGDILQDEEGDIFEIFWSKDEARFKADLIGEKGKVYDEFGMNDCFGLVIGNIYENPNIYKELLTQSTN